MPFTAKFGITRVANVTGLDWLGVPVVMVCRPNSRSLSVSQGKGTTLDAAKASGLMEAIELYHAEHIELPIEVTSFHTLSKHHTVVEAAQLPLVNLSIFHEHKEMLWVEGYDLLQEKSTWVPYECVSNNCVDQNLPGSGSFGMTSNGLASGNNLLEAIVHAICEVVERDATTLWYSREKHIREASVLDLDSCEDQTSQELIARFRESGLHLQVWDTTSDVGISSFLCLLHEDSKDPSRVRYSSLGMGCHASRNIALVRAVTEAAQSRLTLIAGSRDDMFRDQYEQLCFRSEDLSEFCALHPSNDSRRQFRNVPSFESDTFNKDIDLTLDKLRSAGIQQAVVVTLTEAESPFQVVKLLIPDLESQDDHSRYTPGRRAKQLRHRST